MNQKGKFWEALMLCFWENSVSLDLLLFEGMSMCLCIMDDRVFSQMTRRHTLALMLLIHLPPLCLQANVCSHESWRLGYSQGIMFKYPEGRK